MSLNSNLHSAKAAKNDEFYTQLTDIEKELGHYKHHFKDKIVFLNCDDPEESHFWKYFSLNFKHLGLKKLVSTHFEKDKPSYKLEIVADINENGEITHLNTVKTPLSQNGDFRSPESLAILQEADIIVTNPPFSLFREYIEVLISSGKQFLIIGSKNAITYKEVFKLIKDNRLWMGINAVKDFRKPDGSIQSFGNIGWFTNLTHQKRQEKLLLYKKYNPQDYPEYDNYKAIEVSKVADIPVDYMGVMGVPITFLDKYNPDQFEICGAMTTTKVDEYNFGYPFVGGDKVYARILIRRKK